jgi:hypothetical protein
MKKSVVVIGSGLAGSVLCQELAGVAEVTLLEIGEKDTIGFPEIEYRRKKFAAVKTFCLGGGGTTNLWHNGLIPINPADVEDENFRDVLTAARPYTDRAASRLFFPSTNYLAEYSSVVAEMNRLADDLGAFEDGVDCLLYPKKFRKLEVPDEVKAYYDVAEIDFVTGAEKKVAIDFRIGERSRHLAPDFIVISAGTLGTPRLVGKVLAALGAPTGDLGAGLIDHPLGFVGKVKLKSAYAKVTRDFALLDKGGYESCTAARLKSDCGRYTCFAFFRPALTMGNDLAIYKFKSLLGASSGRDRIRNAFSMRIFHPDILAEIFSHLFGMNIRGRIFNILIYFEQKNGRNSVNCKGRDLKVDWGVSDEELAVYNTLLQKLSDRLEPLADEINIQVPITEDWLWSGAHHSGTVRLGNEDSALLDNDLKLKSGDNIYVCDGSVIQEHSYANTGLTIGQLAIRLAENILGQ